MMNEVPFPDAQGQLNGVRSLASAMLDRDAKWNRKNKSELIVRLKTFIDENPSIRGDEKYLFGITLDSILNQISNSLLHQNRSLYYALQDLGKILDEIENKHTLRLETFEDFSSYIIRHKIISTNNKTQYAKLKYTPQQEKLLQFGFSKDWDRRLVRKLIEKHKKTEDFELFKVSNPENNFKLIFYRFYEDNLQNIEPDVTYHVNDKNNELIMKLPIYEAQVELFENDIKSMAVKEIKRHYEKISEKKIDPRPIIKDVVQGVYGFNRVITTITFIFWDRNETVTREIEKDDGFSIIL